MTEMELLRQIGDVEDTCIAEMYEYIARNSKRRSPRIFLLAAIIVVLMLGITVAASGAVRWEGDTWFDHFFVTGSYETDAGAITEYQQDLLDSGLVSYGQAVEQNGYTVTLDSALCDGHRLLAKLILDAPEGIVLEEGRYDVIMEYRPLYPDGTRMPLGAMTGSCGQLSDPDPTDGRLEFLLDVRMQPDPEADEAMLMGASWQICISEILYAYCLDEEYWFDPLATGEWAFLIPFDEYSLLTREVEVLEGPFRMAAKRYIDERSFPVNIRVTSLKIRALSATLTYDKPLTGFWHGIEIEGDIYIVLKDGTKILVDWDMGHNKGKYWQESFSLPVPVAWDDVACVILPNGDQIDITH